MLVISTMQLEEPFSQSTSPALRFTNAYSFPRLSVRDGQKAVLDFGKRKPWGCASDCARGAQHAVPARLPARASHAHGHRQNRVRARAAYATGTKTPYGPRLRG